MHSINSIGFQSSQEQIITEKKKPQKQSKIPVNKKQLELWLRRSLGFGLKAKEIN